MNLFSKLFGPSADWEVRRTIWPFEEGWGVYSPSRRTILETGLPTKERAQEICDFQNSEVREGKAVQS